MKASLSDINSRLINAYQQVAANPQEFADHLEKLLSNHSDEQYYRVREHSLDEGIDNGGDAERAARFVYLNKTGFNGLYRENSSGKFNIPIGRSKKTPRCDRDLILAASKALSSANIHTRSHTFIRPRAEDFLYFDPPYDGTFTAYTSHGFSTKNQQILAQQCHRLADKGCYVMASNADTPMVRDLYQGFHFHEVMAPRSVNSRGDGRQKVQELIICSYRTDIN
jgi:DNA adenine methylase